NRSQEVIDVSNLGKHDDRCARRGTTDAADRGDSVPRETTTDEANVRLLGHRGPDRRFHVAGFSANLDCAVQRHAHTYPGWPKIGEQHPDPAHHGIMTWSSVPPLLRCSSVTSPSSVTARSR